MWHVRTKPRSMVKLMDGAPNYLALEGQNWNFSKIIIDRNGDKQKIYPIRRNYIISSHSSDVNKDYYSTRDFRSGKYDKKDKEAIARGDKATYEFFGMAYLDGNGCIQNTKYGELVATKKLSSEIFLRQMLKMQFPNAFARKKGKFNEGEYVFPMEVVLNVFKHFNELNRFEIGFLFCNNNSKDVTDVVLAINEFRKKYDDLIVKTKISEINVIFSQVMSKYFPNCDLKPATLYGDYSDGLIRYLEYTDLFKSNGRSYYTKIRKSDLAIKKIELLQTDFEFIPNQEEDVARYMEVFGDPYIIKLPWQKDESRRELLSDRIQSLYNKIEIAKHTIVDFNEEPYKDILEIDLKMLTIEQMMRFEDEIAGTYLNLAETIFVEHSSKTKGERIRILEKFDEILSGAEEDDALWLEVNTWKSLNGIRGEHITQRNFSIEVDLTPRSFAPGKGNTPDMEVHTEDYIIIPEVTLTKGKQQWKNEGASVVEHVADFINLNPEKEVYGFFLSKKIDRRTAGMFLIHNQFECFEETLVPIIPLSIDQYKKILKTIYTYDLHIDFFKDLLKDIHLDAIKHKHHIKWLASADQIIEKYLNTYDIEEKLAA